MRFSQPPHRSKESSTKKKPGSPEPGLRDWPREADTITFQEGFTELSRHWRRGKNAQRKRSVSTHYDTRWPLAATVRAACQSCGEDGMRETAHHEFAAPPV